MGWLYPLLIEVMLPNLYFENQLNKDEKSALDFISDGLGTVFMRFFREG